MRRISQEMIGGPSPFGAAASQASYYFVNMGQTWTGMVAGLLLFFGSLGLVAWNELHGAPEMRVLLHAEQQVVEAPCRPDVANEGRLVHVSCNLNNFSTFVGMPGLKTVDASDLTGIRIVRTVEMWQWHETVTERRFGSGGEGSLMRQLVTCSYKQQWNSAFENSSLFVKPDTCRLQFNGGLDCVNPDPKSMRWWEAEDGPGGALGVWEAARAETLSVGGYRLPRELVNQAGEKRQLMPACKHGGGGSECAEDMEAHGGHLYYLSPASNRSSTDDHRLGDVRVKYEIYQGALASVVGQQAPGDTVEPWVQGSAEAPIAVFLIEDLHIAAEKMLSTALGPSLQLSWFLRCLSLLLAFFGLFVVMAPSVSAPDQLIYAVSPAAHRVQGETAAGPALLLAAASWLGVMAAVWWNLEQRTATFLSAGAAAAFILFVLTNRWDLPCRDRLRRVWGGASTRGGGLGEPLVENGMGDGQELGS